MALIEICQVPDACRNDTNWQILRNSYETESCAVADAATGSLPKPVKKLTNNVQPLRESYIRSDQDRPHSERCYQGQMVTRMTRLAICASTSSSPAIPISHIGRNCNTYRLSRLTRQSSLMQTTPSIGNSFSATPRLRRGA